MDLEEEVALKAVTDGVSTRAQAKARIDALSPKASVFRQGVMESDGVTQGQIGSCHLFATQTMLKDATGLSISVARMFLDHLLGYEAHFSPAQLEKNLKEISHYNMDHVLEHRGRVSAERACSGFGSWEGGRLADF